jgi:hypothetical protein
MMLHVRYVQSRDGVVRETKAERLSTKDGRVQLWRYGDMRMSVPVDDVVSVAPVAEGGDGEMLGGFGGLG